MEIFVIILSIGFLLYLSHKNYTKRMEKINYGMYVISKDGYTVIEITTSLLIGTLKTEKYQIYTSPVNQGFILNGEEVWVTPTANKQSLCILVSKLNNISNEQIDDLVANN